MKRFLILVLGLWVLLFTIPLFVARSDGDKIATTPRAQEKIDANTKITLLDNGEVKELTLDVYLQGVVAAEMPALFPEEALKAQAVAARTDVMRLASQTPATQHKGAMVCSDPNHCQAYKPIAEVAANWGAGRNEYLKKITDAVAATDGQILLYNNAPISAVFHSSSGGKTERAADVWGRDVPYLQSVESVGDADAPHYESTVTVPVETFREKIMATYGNAKLADTPESWITNLTRSEAGGVLTLCVGGVNVTGRQMRMLFGLRSTHFTVAASADGIVFETQGYGHGVGMSQYGARGLALQGMGYRDILTWYYQGTTLGLLKS